MSEILSKMYLGLHVKCPLLMSDFNETRIYTTKFSKNTEMETHPVGAAFLHASRERDSHE